MSLNQSGLSHTSFPSVTCLLFFSSSRRVVGCNPMPIALRSTPWIQTASQTWTWLGPEKSGWQVKLLVMLTISHNVLLIPLITMTTFHSWILKNYDSGLFYLDLKLYTLSGFPGYFMDHAVNWKDLPVRLDNSSHIVFLDCTVSNNDYQ